MEQRINEAVSEAEAKLIADGMSDIEVQWLKPQLEAMIQKKIEDMLQDQAAIQSKKEGVYYVPAADTGKGMPGAFCSCGDYKLNFSIEALFKWAQKHEAKTGHPVVTEADKKTTVLSDEIRERLNESKNRT